jgi:membrane protease YdiL (CAAX protease family)
MNRRLAVLATVTLVGFPLLGYAILNFFRDNPLEIMFRSSHGLGMQVLIGIPVGLLAGFGAKWIIERPFLKDIGAKYAKLIQNFRISNLGIWFVSFCAGFGEELLFRGAIQPLIGIWVTAIFFVAIHGYLNPKDWKVSVYGIFMTLVIGALGYLTDFIGIWSAALAHMMIDVVLFYHLTRMNVTPQPHFENTINDE